MRIAVVQYRSGADSAKNLAQILPLIKEAAGQGAEIIVFPEATSQAFNTGRLDTQAASLEGKFSQKLKEIATATGVVIIAGIFQPADIRGDKHRVYNTALVTGDNVHTGYRKIHTYDALGYRESDTVAAGNKELVVDILGLKMGVAICYDLRFPALFQKLARNGAELIVVPTSWADGPYKKEQLIILAQARALDSGAYIAVADQGAPDSTTAPTVPGAPTGIGFSLVVAPNGEIIAQAGPHPEIIYAEIDPDLVAKTHKILPIL
ncbi:carbon-nitrogen hydrolase family protein [Corynebacterium caspium]|uniref:carbon-nitrogen hydrolase family protein n=1 Tax=Corynebacterium caspium TaxID=234828 RepID=UPI00037EB681|nr:carbon-nitrogen hydrolase family protein [Corynebacterium caspium]WKD58638.1 2-oxoglutaramate amidase [Corynebacterium caspium DSM 44850]